MRTVIDSLDAPIPLSRGERETRWSLLESLSDGILRDAAKFFLPLLRERAGRGIGASKPHGRPRPFHNFERIARRLQFVSCEALFAAFLLCHPALISAASSSDQPKRTVVVLGDSIAAGYGLEADQSFPAVLQKKIQKARLNVEVVNAGVS